MPSGSPTEAPLGQAGGRDGRPGDPAIARPSLGQLVLWLSGCAVYFGLARLFLPHPPGTLFEFLQLSALAMYTSLCWTGMAAVVARLIRPSAGRTIEPGAWLLCSLGVIVSVDLLIAFLPAGLILRVDSLPIATSALAFVLPTLSRMPRHWKAVYMLLAIVVAVPLGVVLGLRWVGVPPSSALMARHHSARMLLVPLTLAAAAIMDHRLGIRRGELHWLGVAAAAMWLMR